MRVKTLTVHWHEDCQPIYSADFQQLKVDSSPTGNEFSARLATAGGDSAIRIWKVGHGESLGKIEYLATLEAHTQAVNAVRFSPTANLLASAGDDGILNIWALANSAQFGAGATSTGGLSQEYKNAGTFGSDNDDKELWTVKTACRSDSTDIYDLAWSPDGKQILAASMDNVVRIFCADTGQCLRQLRDHGHYVQGVAWDPLSRYIASLSSDRSLCIYSLIKGSQYKLEQRVSKIDLPKYTPPINSAGQKEESASIKTSSCDVIPAPLAPEAEPTAPEKQQDLTSNPQSEQLSKTSAAAYFHSERFPSFFRRLSFSPDGSLLLTPAGLVRSDGSEDTQNMLFIFSRGNICGQPVLALPGTQRASLAVRFSPVAYKLRGTDRILDLPYRMVYAVAMPDSVIIYDTEQTTPLAFLSNLHYSTFTDLTWSDDGKMLITSSSDGFCSVVEFDDKDLGEVYSGPKVQYSDIGAVVKEPTKMASSIASKLSKPAPEQPSVSEAADKSVVAPVAAVPVVNWLTVKKKPKPKARTPEEKDTPLANDANTEN